MRFNFEQRTEQFLNIVRGIDAIAMELRLSGKDEDRQERIATRLQALSRCLRELGAELATDIAVQNDGHSRMRETLAASERHFRTLAENLPNYLARHTTRAEIVYLNPRLEAIFGRGIDEVAGKAPTQIFPDGRFDGYESAILEAVRTGEEGQLELRFTTQDGEPRIHQIQMVPERDETGVIVSVLVIGGDITARRRAEQDLKRALDFAEGIIAAIPDILFELDRDGRYLNVWTKNPELLALPKEELLGRTLDEVLPAQQASAALRSIGRADREGVTVGETLVLDLPDGSRRWFEYSLAKKLGETPATDTFLILSRDVTERKRIEEALAGREREFRTLVENSPDTIARYDKGLRRVYVNPNFAALVEGGAAALIGKKPSECLRAPNARLYEEKLAEVFASGKAGEFELSWTEKDGTQRCHLIKLAPEFDAHGTVEHVLTVGRDISELQVSRRKIQQMAYYDPLTGLPNRTEFNERLMRMTSDASGQPRFASVVMIDMDRFKGINDTLGHAMGDQLLREAAARLSFCVRPCDTVARFGGDEFAILLPEICARAALEDISTLILGQFGEPFFLNGKEVYVSCSVGVALYPLDSATADDLVKYADLAMYAAKRAGGRSFRFYSRDLTADATAYLLLESELRRAIERDELEVHYQPKVLLDGNRVIGSEALLRWRRPGFGLVPPGQFIPLAEETGLIADLGAWVLREACLTAAEWNAGSAACHTVAVNLSARQFQFRDLVPMLGELLEETGCRPEWLELEITESLLLDEDDTILDTLSALKAMGLSIAIDDFGTGYSALSYLARFPIDTLKIDRSFVQKVTTDRRHAELVKAILSIARCLGQQVVAEGVETAEQAAFLQMNGCQVAQGFLYSKPLPKSDMATLPRQLELDAAAGP